MTETLTRHGLYPLADRFYKFKSEETIQETNKKERDLRARWTGEKRVPKKGEWYLSGSLIAACRAPNDLTMMEYHIAEIIRTETVTLMRVIGPAVLMMLLALTGCDAVPVAAMAPELFAVALVVVAVRFMILIAEMQVARRRQRRLIRHLRIVTGRSGYNT